MDSELEKFLLKCKLVSCEICDGRLFYMGGGKYQCEECEEFFLDDYGKVKEFIEKNGPTPAIIISQATGVTVEMIEAMLHQGKVEIPEGSKYYLKCSKCGGSIRYGRICPACARELATNMKYVMLEDIGEVPKQDNSRKDAGIRFADRHKK